MKRMIVAGYGIVLATALVPRAEATIATTHEGAVVAISNNWVAEVNEQCDTTFNYRQRMTVGEDGGSEMVLTQSIYAPGRYDLVLLGTCGDLNIYGVGSCACSAGAAVSSGPTCDLGDDEPRTDR